MKFLSRLDVLPSVRKGLSVVSKAWSKCLSLSLALVVAAVATVVFDCHSALAADKIILNYGAAQNPITIGELQNFTQTGAAPDEFKTILKISDTDINILRTALGQEIPVSRDFLERVLKSGIGQFILTRLDPVIGTPGVRQNVEEVAGALLESADDGKLTVLELLKNYPINEISVNGALVQQAYDRISFVATQVGPVVEVVRAYAQDLVCDGKLGSNYDYKTPDILSRSSWSNLDWPQ